MEPYYDHNGITIYHGDCREILPFIAPVDLVFTDPPYGIKITGNTKRIGVAPHTGRKKTDDTWDDAPPPKWVIELLKEISKNQIFWGANYFWESFYASQCYIVWDKRGDMPDVPFCDTEFAWTSFTNKPSKKYTSINHGFISDDKEPRFHPTQKPLRLTEKIILDFTEDNDVILDPFVGSGTTLLAAKNTGRKAIGIEVSEKYCAIAVRRLSQEVLPLDFGGQSNIVQPSTY